MRDVYSEYKDGKLTWVEAYLIANNNAASLSNKLNTPQEEVEYWVQQMESLGVDIADSYMRSLGYVEDFAGVYSKPSSDNSLSF